MIRVAAVGDLHVGADAMSLWQGALEPVSDGADLLLLAGDLTRSGTLEDAEALVAVLEPIAIPIVAVLGNHDFHADHPARIVEMLEGIGVAVLEGSSTVFSLDGTRIGIAGSKGFGGGFAGACGSEFGEPEMKAFIRHTQRLADGLEAALAALDAEIRIALLHYSPVAETLQGERLEIYPFLGSYLLGEAIDRAGADLVLHGHAHAGRERGATSGGIRVRNVAQPVIKHAYNLYCCPDARERRHGVQAQASGGCSP
ncbi:MAG TPA: metallophosphoesterase [Myxococcota bacterium]|nr:metallophosphoesterase [Myxococcota bacterium]